MRHFVFALALSVGLWPAAAGAQPLPSGSLVSKGPPPPQLLGANFATVPDVLYSQVPALPKGKGLVVDSVTKNSVAEKIGLRRHDIIMSYGNNSVQDAKQLAGLLWATPPGQNNQFLVLRAGKTVPVQYILKATDLPIVSLIKPSGPPAVNLEVEPLDKDRMKINFTYYAGGSSKLHSFVCEGTVEEIESQLKNQKAQIPGQVQELLDVAVQRLRQMKMR